MNFILSNEQRKHLGLDPIKDSWERVEFDGDQYRPKSWLYFEKDVIKRHVISNDDGYQEYQYSDETRDRKFLLPKTLKGKEKKLTPSVLESRQPQGVYFFWGKTGVKIASYATQTTFFSEDHKNIDLENWLAIYISTSSNEDTFKSGDFFAFKLSRREYGFGRILADISKLRKEAELHSSHGLFNLMGKPVLVKIYRFKSIFLKVNLDELKACESFPSEYVFDNHLYYGQYPIIGSEDIEENDIEFPISYGQSIQRGSQNVFLQWGLIHKELPMKKFSKYTHGDNKLVAIDSPNRKIIGPYRKDSIGFNLSIKLELMNSCINSGTLDSYWNEQIYKREYDLRHPKNKGVKEELLNVFGLAPGVDYHGNVKLKPNNGLKGWFGLK